MKIQVVVHLLKLKKKNSVCPVNYKDLGTLNSIDDTEYFIKTYRIEKGKFGDLALGDTITIQNNGKWHIVEFDYHCDAADAEDVNYINNFHNIALMPVEPMTSYFYNSKNGHNYNYLYSYLNKTTIPSLVNNLKTILNTHLKTRWEFVNSKISTKSGEWLYELYMCDKEEWIQTEACILTHYQVMGRDIRMREQYEGKDYRNYTIKKYEHKIPCFNCKPVGDFMTRTPLGYYYGVWDEESYEYCGSSARSDYTSITDFADSFFGSAAWEPSGRFFQIHYSPLILLG